MVIQLPLLRLFTVCLGLLFMKAPAISWVIFVFACPAPFALGARFIFCLGDLPIVCDYFCGSRSWLCAPSFSSARPFESLHTPLLGHRLRFRTLLLTVLISSILARGCACLCVVVSICDLPSTLSTCRRIWRAAFPF